MTRSSHTRALVLGLGLAAACSDKQPAPSTGRVDGAKTVTRKGNTNTKAFCDVHAEAGAGAQLVWPELDQTPPTSTGETWRWINVWATWCQPCIEEMPRIAQWRDKLATPTRPLEVTFVSIDESDATVAEFRKSNPATPSTLRLAKPEQSAVWLGQLGLAGEPPIPIHVFVDPKNRIRCVRAAAVRDTDFAAVQKLLAE